MQRIFVRTSETANILTVSWFINFSQSLVLQLQTAKFPKLLYYQDMRELTVTCSNYNLNAIRECLNATPHPKNKYFHLVNFHLIIKTVKTQYQLHKAPNHFLKANSIRGTIGRDKSMIKLSNRRHLFAEAASSCNLGSYCLDRG